MLSHLSALLGVGFVLPLVVYLAMRHESEYVAANAREALNFHISVLIYSLCCIPLVFILIGIPLLLVLGLGSLVLGHHRHDQSVQRACAIATHSH